MSSAKKVYIGDGVYAYSDGFQIWLETERGDGSMHEIALECDAIRELVRFAQKEFGIKIEVQS